jgi:hypothetical protein
VPSTFTTNKGIEQPAAGSYSNTWATPVNADWSDIDNAFGGVTTINVAGVATGTYTLTLAQYQPPNIIFTGAITGTLAYIVPPGVGGIWTVYNNTTGGSPLAFGVGSSGMPLSQGQRTLVVSDGTTIAVAQSAASGATPTALVGLTPIAGTSSSFTRSDGAPALNQAIVPTWTGVHTFDSPPGFVNGAYLSGEFVVNSGGVIDATGGGLECKTATAGSANNLAASTAFVAASFAPLASPPLTGTPTSASTPPSGDSTTKIPNTAFVNPSSGANSNGRWRTHPDGSVDMWGAVSSSSSTVTVTFPTPFPTLCLSIVVTPINGFSTFYTTTPSASNTTFTITMGAANTPFSWRASGT